MWPTSLPLPLKREIGVHTSYKPETREPIRPNKAARRCRRVQFAALLLSPRGYRWRRRREQGVTDLAANTGLEAELQSRLANNSFVISPGWIKRPKAHGLRTEDPQQTL